MSGDGEPSFLGTGWAFPPQFGRGGGLAMVSEEQDIRESLHILLSTTPGERVMHPTFGCGLHALVFESINEGIKTRIKDVVARAVALFEHRVELELVAVHADALNEALLRIEICYRVRATNTAGNMVYPFYVDSERNAPMGDTP